MWRALISIFPCVNDYIEDNNDDLYHIGKTFSTEYLCNAKLSGLGENFILWKPLLEHFSHSIIL